MRAKDDWSSGLSYVTGQLKAAPPRERLQHRRDLQHLQVYLTAASDSFREAARHWSRSFAELLDTLERARTLTSRHSRAQRARALDPHLRFAIKLAKNLQRRQNIHYRNRALDDALHIRRVISNAISAKPSDLDPVLDSALGLERARTILHEIVAGLRIQNDFALERFYIDEITRHLSEADFESASAIAGGLVAEVQSLKLGPCDYPDFVMDLREALRHLGEAANDFSGVALVSADLDGVDLSGVRWDKDTRWPSPEWHARIRSASVEDPPGSGSFVVQPADGRDRAAHTSLTPIS
ncbi:hypothetical protein [Streptomyces sp. NPDC002159]